MKFKDNQGVGRIRKEDYSRCGPLLLCHRGLPAQEPQVPWVQHTFKEFSGKSIKPYQHQDRSGSLLESTLASEDGSVLHAAGLTPESLQFLWASSERGLLRLL